MDFDLNENLFKLIHDLENNIDRLDSCVKEASVKYQDLQKLSDSISNTLLKNDNTYLENIKIEPK